MAESEKLPFLSTIILSSDRSILNFNTIFLTKPHIAYESLVKKCSGKFMTTVFNLESDYKLESAQKWITFPGKLDVVFPVQTIQPKVQALQNVPLKELPRSVAIDRLRRQYSKLRISKLLEEADIPNTKLINAVYFPEFKGDDFFGDIAISLHLFDDESFDINTIEGWLDKGLVDNYRYPLPAWALIKTSSGLYSWEMVAVYDFDKTSLKFTTIDLAEAYIHRVYRIHLMFMSENPYTFLERIKTVLSFRKRFDAYVRYKIVMDCALYDGPLRMDLFLLKRILKLSLVNQEKSKELISQTLCKEIQLQYHRVMLSYELQDCLKNFPVEFPSVTIFETKSSFSKKLSSTYSAQKKEEFQKLKKYLRRQSLFYSRESIQAMLFAAAECAYIETMSIFTHTFLKSVFLSEFVTNQETNASTVIKYLKISWPEKISAKICLSLRSIGKGWLDLSVSDWNVYDVAKISKFFCQTRFRMQESLQILMEKSIYNYSNLLNNPCADFLELEDDYVWENDLLTTPFNRLNLPPVFRLVLHISSNGPYYSTNPKEFESVVTKLLYSSLMSTCGIRVIEPDSLLNLPFDKNVFIFTVELIENLYIEHVGRLHASYSKVVIPLNAYLSRYECYVEFHELVVEEFMENFANSEKSSQEVRNEIIWQREQKEKLRITLPEDIIIGPFQIIVEPLKKYLVNKRIQIVRELFFYYEDRMLKINEEILDELVEINRKLNEKLLSVEQLFEVKSFMTTVPDKMVIYRERIQVMMMEYNVLDSFFYNLNDQQFAMKWEAFAWPHKIMKRLIVMKEEHKTDMEEFQRIQIRELTSFQERLESLNEEVMSFSLQFDPEKALEMAVEVKKTWRLIKDLQKNGNLLLFRQQYFEAEELSLEYLDSIIDSFNPYRIMWTACSDFIKLEEITIGNPLNTIDLGEIKENIINLTKTLEQSVEIFEEKEEIKNIAIVFLNKIANFNIVYETIECIKNENWLLMHWQELAQASGVEIKFSPTINFGYCIKKGILNHVPLVKRIAERAILEADSIRLALEEEERLRKEAELALLEKKKNRKCRTDIL